RSSVDREASPTIEVEEIIVAAASIERPADRKAGADEPVAVGAAIRAHSGGGVAKAEEVVSVAAVEGRPRGPDIEDVRASVARDARESREQPHVVGAITHACRRAIAAANRQRIVTAQKRE